MTKLNVYYIKYFNGCKAIVQSVKLWYNLSTLNKQGVPNEKEILNISISSNLCFHYTVLMHMQIWIWRRNAVSGIAVALNNYKVHIAADSIRRVVKDGDNKYRDNRSRRHATSL